MDIRAFTRQDLPKSKGILLYGAGAWGKLVLETLQSWMDEDIDKKIPIVFIDRLRPDFAGGGG